MEAPAWSVVRWNAEREKTLVRLWYQDAPLSNIAGQLGTTPSAITSKARVLGLPGRRFSEEWPQTDIERLTNLWKLGHSTSQIGAIVGKSRSAVLGKVHRLKLQKRRPPRPPLSDAERAARAAERREKNRIFMLAHRAEQRGDQPPRMRLRLPKQEPMAWQGSLDLPLLDLRRNQCRYTYSKAPPYLFCGQPVVEKQSWCEHCSKIVHGGPTNSGKHFRMNGWKAA